MNRVESSVLFSNADESEVIDTRFGKIALQKNGPISFPRGLLGMPEKSRFFLTDFPSQKLAKFKLLQSLDDHGLSFITLPLNLQNGIIVAEDLSRACTDLGMSIHTLVTLLMVSVHRTPGKTVLTVNARAPLLIDSSLKLAAQYVFQSDRYQVQHVITA